jgi:ribosomal protein S18 acetylase RimI-like enzyme
MKIRLLRKSEVRKAAGIAGKNYSKKFEQLAAAELAEMFKPGPLKPTYFVVEEGQNIIGLGGYIQSWMDYNIYHISWVNVLPEYQRRGIGTKLIDYIVREIRKKKEAECILITTRVPEYYQKHWSFRSLGSIGTDGEHLMMLSL